MANKKGPKAVYFRGEIVPFEEDILREFKGHRTITIHDLKPNQNKELPKARQYWSKYICGFLNTGLGGTLYGGIMDNGSVKGFPLSKYQKLHVSLALHDMMSLFTPVVPTEAWSIHFVPVIETGATTYQKDLREVKDELWEKDHRLRDYTECWCDAMSRKAGGNPWYVVEVRIQPWVAGGEVWGGMTDQPSFCAEDSQFYMRKYGITDMYTQAEMHQLREEQRREARFRQRRNNQVEEGIQETEEDSEQLEKGSLEQLERKELEKEDGSDSEDEDFGPVCSIA